MFSSDLKEKLVIKLKDVTKGNSLAIRYLSNDFRRIQRLNVPFIVDNDKLLYSLANELADSVEKEGGGYNRSVRHANSLIYGAMTRFENKVFIPKEKIEWLMGRVSESFIGWYYIRLNCRDEYEQMLLPDYPCNKDDSFSILRDFLYFTHIDYNECLRLIENVEVVCSNYNNWTDAFSWVKKDKQLCEEWLWNYLMSFPQLDLIVPTVYSDRIKVVNAAFFCWDAHQDTKILLIKKIKGAWSQKKYRDKNGSKKLINVYINSDAKKKLDYLAGGNGYSIASVLERLIDEEYRVSKDGKYLLE